MTNNISQQQKNEFLEAAVAAAKLGGDKLIEWMGKVDVREKGPRDLVTQADFDSQQAISEYLLGNFPDHEFLGEESTDKSLVTKPGVFCWVVDPLDGTVNYVHQLNSFSVSIALRYGGETIAGVVYDPVIGEMFSAVSGGGATLNGKAISHSRCTEIGKALVVCSFSSSVDRHHPEVERFLRVLGQAGSIRRLGSAALNLCFVACGRSDSYWATGLNCWDIAAGWLILKESGAVMKTLDGGQVDFFEPKFCAAATEELFTAMQEHLDI
ncbi:inositol monophosphatase family protein [Mariniblastus fucicola]|uniref:Inositol-1-monophosphatase n=1 Tax=Mariniblastus fucicola TaxID=980251 RepID=A0A5B9PDU0_9BACT|nr:inositol monophosphatase family protein [Mariniblastus fucicola]QEG23659.1 Inositol-1-monophosphatase [Mariniblastus fucicola]